MEVYLVGGAVRDRLLGLPVKERDWVVVGATAEQMRDLGYQQVGKDFPVFLHPDTKEEYALARTERKTAPGYTGFEFHASPDVSLEEDLKRRDLTINAIAEAADGTLIDPFGGQDDLAQGRLRHISPAFAEDPVRILRVARLAARFGRWGFGVAHATNALMRDMVAAGEVDHLVPERVWNELQKALCTERPEKFFSVLHGCNALATLFPEIENDYAEDDAAHSDRPLPAALTLLKTSASMSDDPQVRFAVLLMSLAPHLPVEQRLADANALCERFRIPKDYAQLAAQAISLAPAITTADAATLLEVMERSAAFRDPCRWHQLLDCWRIAGLIDADRATLYAAARDKAVLVGAADIKDATLQGPQLGQAIREHRTACISRVLQSVKDSQNAG